MAVRRIRRSTGANVEIIPTSGPGWNSIRTDRPTDTLVFGTGENGGVTEKTVADTTSVQTLSNKTIIASVFGPFTAFAGGGQASATQLSLGVNNVTVVATAGDSVKLPLAIQGEQVTVFNNGAASLQVFGSGTDTINGIAFGTGIAQAAGTVATYTALTSAPGGNWAIGVAVSTGGVFTLAPLNFLAADQALPPNTSATYVITKTSAEALTLAAGADGTTITVTSNTAFAHTITTATLFNNGIDTNTTTATFTAQKGATITLLAVTGRWNVISRNGVTIS